MSKYTLELRQSTIKDLNIHIDMDESKTLKIDANFAATLFEPVDSSDPTVLIKTVCNLTADTDRVFSVVCAIDFVFSVDPIPEDRASIIDQDTQELIRDITIKKVLAIIKEMGHSFAMNL